MIVSVRVKPSSRQAGIEEQADGTLLVRLKSAPVEGKANEELLRQLANRFGVPRSRIRIKAGASARTKLVEIL